MGEGGEAEKSSGPGLAPEETGDASRLSGDASLLTGDASLLTGDASPLAGADDRFHEECAVVGIYGHSEAANLAYLGLYSMQHRGQEGSGIVSSNGKALISHRGLGLVADVFHENVIRRLVGSSAIGH
ncbi:MAG: hypothetical protein ABR538_04960, partial [Candidatus Binatia bacterium]